MLQQTSPRPAKRFMFSVRYCERPLKMIRHISEEGGLDLHKEVISVTVSVAEGYAHAGIGGDFMFRAGTETGRMRLQPCSRTHFQNLYWRVLVGFFDFDARCAGFFFS